MLYSSWPVDANDDGAEAVHRLSAARRGGAELPEVKRQFLEMSDKILGEDVAMVESLQNASRARHFVPGRMSQPREGRAALHPAQSRPISTASGRMAAAAE